MTQHIELGKEGEAIAAAYLERNGYEILDRNYRFKKLELDIICKKDDLLVIVEVKTRTTRKLGDPQAISIKKQRQVIRAANFYIQEKGIDLEVRLDIIGVIKNQYEEHLEHVEGAFVP